MRRPSRPVPPVEAKHNLGTNRRFGPFDARTSEVQDTKLDVRMWINNMPGFQGDWFDATDVEQFLRLRGVVFHPKQDCVTAEVDVTVFHHDDVHEDQQRRWQQQVDGELAAASSSSFSWEIMPSPPSPPGWGVSPPNGGANMGGPSNGLNHNNHGCKNSGNGSRGKHARCRNGVQC